MTDHYAFDVVNDEDVLDVLLLILSISAVREESIAEVLISSI